MKIPINPIPFIGFLCLFACSSDQLSNAKLEPGEVFSPTSTNASLRPYEKNPFYWQYDDEPVMLLGGSKDDNLFQIPDLYTHLTAIHEAGGNYVRNTMSSRDEGNIRAFKQLPDGRYDLDKWNDAYWKKFDTFLALTDELGIFVQIEFWDQWDHIQGLWDADPWNPDMNINYTASNTILEGNGSYENINHYSGGMHPFFLTVPKLQNDKLVLHYQKKFVNKVMAYTLQYDHILYTITNELFDQHPIAWSYFWINHINKKAQEADKKIQVTEMFQKSDVRVGNHKAIIKHPKIFDYIDISQNSGQLDQAHWDKLQWTRNKITDNPRPMNHTKTYGSDEVGWTDGAEQGIERFWRDIIGGAASVRFHRPPAGIGLSTTAQAQIKSARMLLSAINIFKAEPDDDFSELGNRKEDEAYLTRVAGQQYAVYFPEQGDVTLDLRKVNGEFELRWLNLDTSTWSSPKSIHGSRQVELKTSKKGSWIVVLTKK